MTIPTRSTIHQLNGHDVVFNDVLSLGMVSIACNATSVVLTLSQKTADRIAQNLNVLGLIESKINHMRTYGFNYGQVDLSPPSVSGTVGPPRSGRVPAASKRPAARSNGKLELAQEAMANLIQEMTQAMAKPNPNLAHFASRYAELRAQITRARTAVTELEGAWEVIQDQMVALMGDR